MLFLSWLEAMVLLVSIDQHRKSIFETMTMLMLIVQIEMTPFDQCRKGGLGAVTKLSATSALIKGTPSADSYKNVSNLEIHGV